jgi:flagellum-specific ATP synthase
VIADSKHKKAAGKLRETLAKYNEAEDLINIGAYVKGSNHKIDYAVEKIDSINNFLRQATEEDIPFEKTVQTLISMFS